MHAVIFTTPMGASGADALFFQCLTLPLAVVGTVVVLSGTCLLAERKKNGWTYSSAILLSALVSGLVALLTTVFVILFRGLTDEPSWIPCVVGVLVAIVVGLFILYVPSPHPDEPGQNLNIRSTDDGDDSGPMDTGIKSIDTRIQD